MNKVKSEDPIAYAAMSAYTDRIFQPPEQAMSENRIIDQALALLEGRMRKPLETTPFSAPAAVKDYARLKLREYPYEVFACPFLDNRHRLLAYEEMFRGTIDGASVHPREVVRAAMQVNAAAVIFAHNHPSGVAVPSASDLKITQRLKEALALIDARVLDHVIVGENEAVSLAETGAIW